jgi:hypothetical protein
MQRRNAIAPPPEELAGADLSIDYVSPVARAQKSQQVFNFYRFLEQMMPLANIKPEILDNINGDETFRWAHATLDAPTQTLVDKKEMEASRQQRAQQMQQQEQAAAEQQQAETMNTMAQGMGNMAGALKNGQ